MSLSFLFILGSFVFGSAILSAAKPKSLPVGSCIANSLLCNANDPDIDPWEVHCYTGAVLKIDQVGKRSYKTSCVDDIISCKEFISFEDAKAYYFPIECPPKVMRLHNSVPLPKGYN